MTVLARARCGPWGRPPRTRGHGLLPVSSALQLEWDAFLESEVQEEGRWLSWFRCLVLSLQ